MNKSVIALALAAAMITPTFAAIGEIGPTVGPQEYTKGTDPTPFSIHDGVVSIHRIIGVGDGKKFLEFMDRVQSMNPTTVSLQNDGGDFDSAIEIALYVRDHGMTTVVDGVCASSCAFIWLAGETKVLGENAVLEIHPPYYGNTGIVSPEGVTSMGWLLGELGYDANVAYAIGFIRSPAFMRLTPEIMEKWGVEVTVR